MTKTEAKEVLFSLPVEERLELAQELWESLGEELEALPLTQEHRELLEARLDAYLANPEDVLTWSEIKAQLQTA